MNGENVTTTLSGGFKVVVPSYFRDSGIAKYLEKSPRFKSHGIDSFENLQDYLRKCFNIDFELIYLDDIDKHIHNFKDHNCVVFLSVDDIALGDRLRQCVELGFPIVFLKYDPGMDCEIVCVNTKENYCFKYRPNCEKKQEHCKEKFFKKLNFDHKEGVIYKIKEIFGIDNIPLFQISFLIDFLIWYKIYGLKIKQRALVQNTMRDRKEYTKEFVLEMIPFAAAIAKELAAKSE